MALSVQAMLVPFLICNMEGVDAFLHASATPDEDTHPLIALLMICTLPGCIHADM